MPALPFFTLINFVLILIVLLRPDMLQTLTSPWFMPVGLLIIGLSGVVYFVERSRYRLAYDFFLVGTLIVWWIYWREVYQPNAPMFKFYPVYFSILSVLLTNLIINQKHCLDDDQIRLIRLIYANFLFRADLLVGLTLASLYLRDQYVLYPVIVSFVYVRYVFTECLEFS